MNKLRMLVACLAATVVMAGCGSDKTASPGGSSSTNTPSTSAAGPTKKTTAPRPGGSASPTSKSKPATNPARQAVTFKRRTADACRGRAQQVAALGRAKTKAARAARSGQLLKIDEVVLSRLRALTPAPAQRAAHARAVRAYADYIRLAGRAIKLPPRHLASRSVQNPLLEALTRLKVADRDLGIGACVKP